jgi:hypothetical protein
MTSYTYSFGKLTIYKPELAEFLDGEQGQVQQSIKKRVDRILIAARAQVGHKTYKLRMSLRAKHYRVTGRSYFSVGSDVNYALVHHEGSKPHKITPKGPHMLRFTSGSRIIYTREVMHPGTRPNRYLSDNLYLALV